MSSLSLKEGIKYQIGVPLRKLGGGPLEQTTHPTVLHNFLDSAEPFDSKILSFIEEWWEEGVVGVEGVDEEGVEGVGEKWEEWGSYL